jgi:hypothetical protein
MKLENFLDNTIKQYNLLDILDSKGFIMICVAKGMYGLSYAGIITQQLLKKRLKGHGYTQSEKKYQASGNKSHVPSVSPQLWTISP